MSLLIQHPFYTIAMDLHIVCFKEVKKSKSHGIVRFVLGLVLLWQVM